MERTITGTVGEYEQHLERAKEYIAIAESGNAKREAYIRAAEEVAAAVAEGATKAAVATAIGKSRLLVRQFLDWRESGYKAETPWLADEGATTRAAKSHTKSYLKNATTEQVDELIDTLPPEQVEKIAARVSSKVARLDTPFQAMSVINHLEAALDGVNEMISDGAPSADDLEQVKAKAEAIVSAVEFAEALAGSDA